MNWDQFLIQLLAELGLQVALAPLLEHISKGIFLGAALLRSDLKRRRQVQSHIKTYNASDLLDLWRDVYGLTWVWDAWRNHRTIHEGLRLELRGVTLHEYLSTRPGVRYTMRSTEYKSRVHQYFSPSYLDVAEELDSLRWGQVHRDIGILDIRYAPILTGTEPRYLLGATAGEAEGSPSIFPIVVGEEVYQQIVNRLKLHGAVRVERVVGQIQSGDERLGLPFHRELHRDPLFLYADNNQRITVLDRPHRILADAWTVAKIDGVDRILAFTFPLGTVDWEQQLSEKCCIVEKFCRDHGGSPLFDFDAQQKRFETAVLNPGTIQDWYNRAKELQVAL